MKRVKKLLQLNKRQKFVIAVAVLSVGIFISEFFAGINLIVSSLVLSFVAVGSLYVILRKDVNGTFFYPLFILPLLYTLAFSLFYSIVPPRLIARVILTVIYAFGLYSLFLTQNIFAVSSIRTINLLRSARIVSFVITIVVLFALVNIIFSLRLPFYVMPIVVAFICFLLNFQSLWVYSLDRKSINDIILYSFAIGITMLQLAFVLIMWPVTAAIYAIFITGVFYMYSGLSHAWIDKRLFKGILWEYVWVGFLSTLILIIFSDWGI